VQRRWWWAEVRHAVVLESTDLLLHSMSIENATMWQVLFWARCAVVIHHLIPFKGLLLIIYLEK
jgi:hypothetical protein